MTQVIFDDGVDPYFARQVVAERLTDLGGDMPAGVSATMGPVATAMVAAAKLGTQVGQAFTGAGRGVARGAGGQHVGAGA